MNIKPGDYVKPKGNSPETAMIVLATGPGYLTVRYAGGLGQFNIETALVRPA